jgi:BirA family biotin operon repressor/biotin-[acetyl-CoA-carboxylase] ligase
LVETLDELGIREARIKPPNDLYLHGRKMAGILVETRTGKHPFAVVGIGLNVNHRLEDFPPELLKSATSLLIASGQRFNRNHVAGVLLKALGRSEELLRDNPAALLAVWNNLLIPDPEIRQD